VVHEQWDDALKLAVHRRAELEMGSASWVGFRSSQFLARETACHCFYGSCKSVTRIVSRRGMNAHDAHSGKKLPHLVHVLVVLEHILFRNFQLVVVASINVSRG
jgi:hypothetical protein